MDRFMPRKSINEQYKDNITRGFKVRKFLGFFSRRFMDSYLKTLFTRCGYQTCSVPLDVVCGDKTSKETIVPGK